MEELLQVGVITSTHGVRGEVKVFPTTDDPNRFKSLKHVLLDTGREKKSLEVQGVKFFKQFVILKFKGIDNINDIERYKRCPLVVERKDAVELEEDEYFIADMIGIEVVTEDDKPFGTLKDVMETGANDVYVIDTDEHGEVLVPAIRECILDVDIENQKMKIHLMDGLEALNIRDYAFNKHHSVDDYPYGGGAGMLMQAEPVYQCYDALARQITERKAKATEEKLASGEKKEMSGEQKRTRVIYLSPQGKTFNQSMAEEFAQEEDLVFLCGHYEGIDERVLEEIVTDYVSIGDYVLTGGELPAMIMIDAISRLVPGVLHNDVSAEFESFQDNLLEYPQYSRPEVWHDRKVPEILMSGHHANIEKWRREQSVIRTAKNRPDLLEKAELTEKEKKLAEEVQKEVKKSL